MATSIPEQIAVKVKARLEQITTANGYELDVAEVVRPTRLGGFRPQDKQLVITQETITRVNELSHPGNPPAIARNLPLKIAGALRASETDTTPSDTQKNQFWADVLKALGDVASGDWTKWDGLAIDSRVDDVEDSTQDDGSSDGFYVILNVIFRTDETNLYNVRA